MATKTTRRSDEMVELTPSSRIGTAPRRGQGLRGSVNMRFMGYKRGSKGRVVRDPNAIALVAVPSDENEEAVEDYLALIATPGMSEEERAKFTHGINKDTFVIKSEAEYYFEPYDESDEHPFLCPVAQEHVAYLEKHYVFHIERHSK